MRIRGQRTSMIGDFYFWKTMSFQKNPKFTKMIPNGYLIFEDESFLDSTVAKMNALRKSGQFCDVRLQVRLTNTPESAQQRFVLLIQLPIPIQL